MFVAEVVFQMKNSLPLDEVSDLVNRVLGVWRRNGQVYGSEFTLLSRADTVTATLKLPEADSLNHAYDGVYVRQALKDLEAKGIEAKIYVLGSDLDGLNACNCTQSNALILFANWPGTASPLMCGGCFRPIPLYKTPKIDGEEYHDILAWESSYQSCDHLQLMCGTLERAASREMSELDSRLSQNGMGICAALRERTGAPVYYYLFKYYARSLRAEHARKCPSCSGDWFLEESWHDRFDFRCDRCYLVSNVAWDVRP